MSEPTWEKLLPPRAFSHKNFARSGYTVNSTSIALALARSGHGIALVPRRLALPDLKSKALIEPVSEMLKMEKSYVCLSPKASSKRRLVKMFVEHLKQ
ncbi:LysR substrate-binding domain-containing protein [Ruegeria halocynthiae]|uniref:LysR substrate-binding domain-containing protein n=1 Tax=Ruegeria halocynthiae TaxID=985054 RepID=UPI00094480E8|nr:LysR substrate-binding domain-containing protein [Ruegeria halocynthiae]